MYHKLNCKNKNIEINIEISLTDKYFNIPTLPTDHKATNINKLSR